MNTTAEAELWELRVSAMCEGQGGNETASPEITVTPDMIEAGLKEYLELLPDDAPRCDYLEREMVRRVFLAMRRTMSLVKTERLAGIGDVEIN